MSPFIVALFVSLLSVAIIGFVVTGSKARVTNDSDAAIAEYGAPLRILSIFVVVLLASLAVLVSVRSPGSADVVIFLVLMAIFVGGYLVLDTYRTRIEFDKESFSVRPALQRERRYSWSEVSDLEYSGTWMWYVVTTDDGKRFRVHNWLSGGELFVDFVRRWSRYNNRR